ncbi:uncharacterized protein LOC115743494 isoform X2 [Rhodamnia argentea]|uniref:Enhancer of polycomb-like protein n=1 Tax=Rhodamnia argentea TaxID=178133 RepID=A0A8B8PH78_9MYRT|nr:uncharacterized protein LOC115743494 isoform X2 [Rhodamnia argentea]
MEHKVESSNGTQAPKKARCLAVKSLYKSGSSKEDPKRLQSKNLKRKISSDDGGDENKKRKSRKEVSLSSLKKRKEKRLSDVTNAGAHFGSHDSSESKPEVDERPSSNGNLNGIGLSLDDNVVKIPKRKRGTSGRKRLEHTQESNPAEPSISRLDFADPSGKLTDGDPERGSGDENIKREDAFDDLKENGHSVGGPLQEQDYLVRSSTTNNGKSKKSVKNRRKQREVKPGGVQTAVVEAGSAVDVSAKRCDDQEDDEENLEENAARMLSSRFDPSCTGFSSRSRASPLPSPSPSPSSNSLYFLLSSNGKFLDQGSASRASPNSPSVKAANRALRPRNQHGEKLRSRKRRHFYEIPSDQVDAYWVMNKRIKVFWPLDQCWYHGLVNDYDGETKLHHVKYDDRDEEWIDLQKERIKLLLLPGEAQTKFAVGGKKRSVERTNEEEERPLTSANDGCISNYMDTEPIISWLARSSRGVKSSSSRSVKKRILGPSLKMKPSSSAVGAVDTCGATTAGSFPKGSHMAFHGDCATTGGPFRAGKVEKVAKSSRSMKGGKAPVVYYRKRFRRAGGALYQRTEDDSLSLGKSDSRGSLLTIQETGCLKLIYLVRRESNDIMVSSLLRPFRVEESQLVYDLVLLYYGRLMTVWPVVKLEMLFVDSMVGLRLLLFEGCLGKAVAFAISILNLLSESNGEVKFVSLRSPITSVRFKFSCVQGCENQLVFGYYNFLRLKRSKRLCLESILRENCLLVEKLSPSECTYNALQNGDIPLLASAALDSSLEGLQKMTSEAIWPSGESRGNGDDNGENSSGSDAEYMKLPPFALPFTAAPTFFLSLHLKLLMNHSVSKISFVELNQEKSAENASILAQPNTAIDNCSKNDMGFHTSQEAPSRESHYLRCAKDDQAVEMVVCKGADMRTPQDNQSGNLHTGRIRIATAVDGDEVGQMQEGQGNYAASEKKSSPLQRITNGACPSLNGIKIDIPHYNEREKPVDDGSLRSLLPTDMPCDMNGILVPSPNPTAPRSVWHRSRSSSFYGHFSRGWSDAKSDGSLNSFGNGPKKPRTHVTYSYPSGVSGSSSKPQQRTIPHKRIRRPNEKRASDVARVSQRNWELLSCHANLLITVGDRGWRESGAEVVLELVENEWNLAVKVSGTTKYSHKAHQFLQPGSTNRYTHAMMWRGGKEWTLEFSDRSQWALFKEMHEECYNRNFRAASVKNIPIPGVRVVEDYDDNGMELSFRSPAIYFQQVETDIEMALNPSRVLYDMDSDDEQWISSCQGSTNVHESGSGHISVEIFEWTMDMFEKKAHALQRDHFTSEEIDDLKLGAGPVVRAIYEHWQQKRQKKGMPLIRHLQPPSWEKYQQQLREWELALNKGNSAPSDGCQKTSAAERPPMFAFCMKPRGLEVPNKGSKQRSQKRFSVTGQSNGYHGDHDSFHAFGRRLNGPSFGDDRALYLGHNYGHVDNSQLAQTSPLGYSPRDVPGQGYFPVGNDGFNRNYPPRQHRYKSKKSGAVASPRPLQMVTAYGRGTTGSKKDTLHWNSHQHFSSEGSHRPSGEQWDQVDMEEYKLLDASGAARYASNLAKLKRERAQRLLCKADVAVHRAVVALMTAEAMKAPSEDRDDG